MEAPGRKLKLLAVAAVAVFLVVGLVSVAAFPAKLREAASTLLPGIVKPKAPGRIARAASRCRDCGVVQEVAPAGKRWSVTVDLQDGSRRIISYGEQPAFKAGDKVRVVSGRLASHPG